MTDQEALEISSLQNPRIKTAVKLRQRSHRTKLGLMIIEGYREIKRACENGHPIKELFICEELFQGSNEQELIENCISSGAALFKCAKNVFEKISYRDRPDGLLAISPHVSNSLDDLSLPENAMVIVAEAIEKPGNLGTILRSADAAGCNAVIICDKCTDINNPNVVRASIGTLFSIPVVETTTEEAITWLDANGYNTVAATPHASMNYTEPDLTKNTAIIVGTEQYGLSEKWLNHSNAKVRIPMLGQADSLNVASATTILLYETVRQRHCSDSKK